MTFLQPDNPHLRLALIPKPSQPASMSELIRQRGPRDCGIAAIAMFTGRPYEEVLEAGLASGGYLKGGGTRSSGEILHQLGYHWENLVTDTKPNTRRFRTVAVMEYYQSPDFVRDILWGRPCLMSVPSLNKEGGYHLIYYDGQRILDPQEGRKGKKFYTDFKSLKPRSAVVWGPECP